VVSQEMVHNIWFTDKWCVDLAKATVMFNHKILTKKKPRKLWSAEYITLAWFANCLSNGFQQVPCNGTVFY